MRKRREIQVCMISWLGSQKYALTLKNYAQEWISYNTKKVLVLSFKWIPLHGCKSFLLKLFKVDANVTKTCFICIPNRAYEKRNINVMNNASPIVLCWLNEINNEDEREKSIKKLFALTSLCANIFLIALITIPIVQ